MYRAAVSKGIRFLNKNYPQWIKTIDVELLDMSSCLKCILGQCFGNFNEACSTLIEDPAEYGFSLPFVSSSPYEWTELKQEWVRQIRALKGETNNGI